MSGYMAKGTMEAMARLGPHETEMGPIRSLWSLNQRPIASYSESHWQELRQQREKDPVVCSCFRAVTKDKREASRTREPSRKQALRPTQHRTGFCQLEPSMTASSSRTYGKGHPYVHLPEPIMGFGTSDTKTVSVLVMVAKPLHL